MFRSTAQKPGSPGLRHKPPVFLQAKTHAPRPFRSLPQAGRARKRTVTRCKNKIQKNQKFSKKDKRALDTKRVWVIYSFSRRNEAAASRKGGQKASKKIKKLTKALDKLVKSVLISFSPSVKTVDTGSLKRKSVKEKERQDSRRRRKFPSVWKSFSSIERMPAEPRKRFCKRRPEPEGSGCSYQFIGWDG